MRGCAGPERAGCTQQKGHFWSADGGKKPGMDGVRSNTSRCISARWRINRHRPLDAIARSTHPFGARVITSFVSLWPDEGPFAARQRAGVYADEVAC